ncbi:MAG: hypothetical protein COU51_03995 [Parcubacteria group bacterium CG10_big_fil_rev_8_21_14_0_10_36_14]|nr:MAG: hypothetical protein COU51_03995 [Parcubacteria group bacterium CG10_big_fil_rev_8_21_14_0_10_36_14]
MKEGQEKELAIIMYHYVRDADKTPFPKINAIGTDLFKNHIERFKSEYEIISLEDVRQSVLGQKELPSKACVFTFDDGLSDHYDSVFPILKKYGIKGVFFPITMSLEGKVANVHKVHFLLAKIGTKRLAEEYYEFIKKQNKTIQKEFALSDKEKRDDRYIYDDVLTVNLKIILQTLPEEKKMEFLGAVFPKYIGDEREFCENLYLNKREIAEMAEAGMTIGTHGDRHLRLDELSKNDMYEEIKKPKDILENIINIPIYAISYPHGNYNANTIAILEELGYDVALSTKLGINGKNLERWALKRLNAKLI